jgi:ribosome maturation factor RimP
MKDLVGLTREALAEMNIEVVDVERAPLGLLRVTIDRPLAGDGGLTSDIKIEDCEQVSRQLARVYEVEGIDYKRLEVGSPGVDRPLKSKQDFERFVGERVEVRLRSAVDNQRTFRGFLQLSDSTDSAKRFMLQCQENKSDVKYVAFDIEDVERAKLDPLLNFKGRGR